MTDCGVCARTLDSTENYCYGRQRPGSAKIVICNSCIEKYPNGFVEKSRVGSVEGN